MRDDVTGTEIRAAAAHPPTRRADVVIAGGGVAGLALANALARRGVSSVVLERRRAPGEIDRGDVIHDSVLPILRGWHLDEALRAYGPVQLRLFRILNARGQTIFEVDLERDLGRPVRLTLVTHPDLERILEHGASQSGLVSVRRDVACLDLLVEAGRVVGVRTAAGEILAPLTVVANGAQSTLRDRYFPARSLHEYPFSFYNARIKLLPEYADAGVYILGPTGVMVMAPLPKGEMRIGIQFRRTGDSEGISPRNLREVIARRFEAFPLERLEFLAGHVYHLSRSIGRSLWIPGAVLIGDAAHTVHPVGGQGMNLAFQDAELLAGLLHTAEAGPAALDQACRVYSARRRQEVKRVMRLTHMLGLVGSLEKPCLIRMRETLIRSGNRSSLLKKLVVRRFINVA